MIKIEGFKGIAPRFSPQRLPDQAAQTALNCRFDSGTLKAYGGMSATGATTNPSAVSMFLDNRQAGTWLSWAADTDAVRSPIAKDAYDRIYLSNGTKPKMRAVSAAFYDLGIAVFPNGASAVIDATNREDPIVETSGEQRFYVVTFVSAYGEEGPPCDPFPAAETGGLAWFPGDVVEVAGIPTIPSDWATRSYNYTKKRIYRINVGSTSAEYQLVAEIDLATTTYTDSIPNSALGVVLPSATWDEPEATMQGLCLHPAGFAVGFAGKTLYCSELYLPHAWPYSYSVGSEIVGIATFGNSIAVLTQDFPYIFSGQTPDTLVMEKIETSMACTCKRGIVDLGSTMIYPSPEGLVSVGISSSPDIITKALLTRENWEAYHPENMVAAQWEGKYVAYFPTADGGARGFIFDPVELDLVHIDTSIEALFYDNATGNLYVKPYSSNSVMEFGAGATLTYVWKSKKFLLDKPTGYAVVQVYAESYNDLLIALYADGNLCHEVSVTSKAPIWLPSGFVCDIWEVSLSGTDQVNSVHLATSPNVLRGMS